MPVELDGVTDLGHVAVDHDQSIALRGRREGDVRAGRAGELRLGVVGRGEMGVRLDDRAPEPLDRPAQGITCLGVGRLALGQALAKGRQALAERALGDLRALVGLGGLRLEPALELVESRRGRVVVA